MRTSLFSLTDPSGIQQDCPTVSHSLFPIKMFSSLAVWRHEDISFTHQDLDKLVSCLMQGGRFECYFAAGRIEELNLKLNTPLYCKESVLTSSAYFS